MADNLPLGRYYRGFALLVVRLRRCAIDRAIDRQRGDILTIACLGTFALKVLFPNLQGFISEHPEIGLRVRTIVAHEQEAFDGQDLCRNAKGVVHVGQTALFFTISFSLSDVVALTGITKCA